MPNPYHYVRFRWWREVDLQQVSKALGEWFTVEMRGRPSDERVAIHKDERDEVQVTADTLIAMLSRFRAVLSQKEAAPFTSNDMLLRKKMFKL